MKRLIFGLSAIALLSGCSSTPMNDEDVGIMDRPPETIDKPPEDSLVSLARNANKTVPSWFLTPPEDSDEKIYAVGTGLSDDMQFSLDKAVHSAKVILGDKMVNNASSSIKSYIEDNAKGSLSATTKNTVKVSRSGFKGADISKYKIEKSDVYLDRRDFRTYVLVSLNPQNRDHGIEEVNTFSVEDKVKVNAAMEDL
jgi:hypothetical protein